MNDASYRIGIDLGGTKIEGILLDSDGAERARLRIPTPRQDYTATVQAVATVVAQLESGIAGAKPSVGVGIPGTVSPATGRIKNANSTWIIGKPLDADISAAIDRPIRMANDANCFAVSEATDGAAAGKRVVFGVIIGTGVGGGIVIDNKPLVGINAIGGEWGHNPLPWPGDDERPGPQCYCGLQGCIETFLSGPGLAADAQDPSAATAEAIANKALAGDQKCISAVKRYENRLARALAHVINLIDPDVIVLGGGVSNMVQLTKTVPALWAQWVFSDRVDTQLVRNKHGDSSGVRGAAWLWPRS